MMPENRTQILTAEQVQKKIIRMAHEIAEFNYDEPEVVIVGLGERGFQLAERLCNSLANHFSLSYKLGRLQMDKTRPVDGDYQLSLSMDDCKGKSVILVDDVLESGRTLIYAAGYLLQGSPKKLTTVVLVDRMHPKFPITADFVGLTLSTTMQQHIMVELAAGSEAVYLQ